MTFIKPSIVALTAMTLFGTAFASANDAPASFSTLDQDGNGIVNFSEYVKDAERRDQNMTSALRQFNIISKGEQTFTQDQYASAFAIQGSILVDGGVDKTVIMPVESEKVLGALATGIVIDEPQAEASPQINNEMNSEIEVQTKTIPDVDVDLTQSRPDISAETDADLSVDTQADVTPEPGL